MEIFSFDPEHLRERYRVERDKRLRSDGLDQYVEAAGEFSYFVDDPYVAPGFTRDPYRDEVDAVVIGGGIGGLLAAVRLKDAGLDSVRIIDKAGDFGGTWYWNRYPGAQCDIESYIYLPLLEEMGYVPTEKYAHGPEILSYLQSIGRRFGLYEHACLQTEITGLRWHQERGQWVVATNRDDEISARYVVMCSGPFNRPKLPGIPGITTYAGHTFHTSRWDYDYTSGDSRGGLVGLTGKRVAVIGTGATAVQCVPKVAEFAEHLFVFQRTPSSISERGNAPTDPVWAENLQPGWHRERRTNFNCLVSGLPQPVDLVGDKWTSLAGNVAALLSGKSAGDISYADIAEAAELADFKTMEDLRDRIDAVVTDRSTAEALKPYYRMFCKRPCFSDDYLPTFNRSNVTLVDTEGRGVERFSERGPVVDAVEYEVDCVIFATGFEVGTSYTRRAGFDVAGRHGVRLSEKWADGPSTFHGLFTHGFPNLFMLGITQSGLTINFPHCLDEQTIHLAHVVKHSEANGFGVIEATQEAEAAWVATMRQLSRLNGSFLMECTPGYYNQEGRPADGNSYFSAQYGKGSEAFFALIREWRDAGDFAGIEFRQAVLRQTEPAQ